MSTRYKAMSLGGFLLISNKGPNIERKSLDRLALMIDCGYYTIHHHGERNPIVDFYNASKKASEPYTLDYHLIDTDTINLDMLNQCLEDPNLLKTYVSKYGKEIAFSMLAGTADQVDPTHLQQPTMLNLPID